MITTISKNNFLKALQATEKIISRNINLPILNNILLRTEKGRLRVTSTNLEIGVNYWVGAKIDEEGDIAIPARTITDFIQNIQDDRITLTTKKNTLFINSDNYKTQILGSETKEYPLIPQIDNEPFLKINSSVLKNVLTTVVEATSVSETRPELTGVYVHTGEGKVNFVATDSFRLSEKNIPYKDIMENSFIIPRPTTLEIIRILSDLNEDISIIISDNQILFKGEEFQVISRLIEGQYPDYKRVIPDKFISKALFNKDDLQKQIKLSSIFSSNIYDIKFEVKNDKTIISAQNQDKGEIKSSISSILKNDPFEIAINYNYLLDGLKVINSKKVIFEFTGDGSPLIIKPEEGNNQLYLIMPLRQ